MMESEENVSDVFSVFMSLRESAGFASKVLIPPTAVGGFVQVLSIKTNCVKFESRQRKLADGSGPAYLLIVLT